MIYRRSKLKYKAQLPNLSLEKLSKVFIRELTTFIQVESFSDNFQVQKYCFNGQWLILCVLFLRTGAETLFTASHHISPMVREHRFSLKSAVKKTGTVKPKRVRLTVEEDHLAKYDDTESRDVNRLEIKTIYKKDTGCATPSSASTTPGDVEQMELYGSHMTPAFSNLTLQVRYVLHNVNNF